jgi:hypothetical protein
VRLERPWLLWNSQNFAVTRVLGVAPLARIEPTYRFHRKTGKAIVTYYARDGERRSTLLPGHFNSDESRRKYKRILAILKANGEPQPQSGGRADRLARMPQYARAERPPAHLLHAEWQTGEYRPGT